MKEKKEKEAKKQEASKKWNEYYEANHSIDYKLEDLSIYDEIYLHIMIIHFSDNAKKYLNFSELNEYKYPILYENFKILIDKNLIILNIDNFLDTNTEFYLKNKASDNYNYFRWILNIKNKDNELMTIHEYLLYMSEKKYSEEEKNILWKEIYRHELFNYTFYQCDRYLKKTYLNSMTIDYICELMIDRYPLSKTIALIYFTISSTMRYMAKYHTNEVQVNTYFRNRITELVETKDPKTIKDFNRPIIQDISIFNDYVLSVIL